MTAKINPQPSKILVPRFDTLGDLVLMEGLLEGLLERFPAAEVTLLVQRHLADLGSLFPQRLRWLTTVIKPHQPLVDGAEAQQLIQDLGSLDWDWVLTAAHTRTWADEVIAAAVKGAARIGLGRWEAARPPQALVFESLGLTTECPFDILVAVEEKSHEVDKYRALWRELTGEPSLPEPKLSVNEHQLRVARQMLENMQLKTKSFCICFPAGTRQVAIKAWPVKRFVEIIAWMEHEYGIRTLVAGHRSEAQSVQAAVDLAKEKGASPALWVGRDGDVPILAALSAEARFYLGNDTGPMHVAAAVDTPVAAIFGGGTWPRFIPRGKRSFAIAGEMPCFGCGWSCLLGDAPCMTLTTVEDVKKAVALLLNPAPAGEHASQVISASTKLGDEASCYISKALATHQSIEQDRRHRLADNFRLQRLLADCEADRAARIEQIGRLGKQLEESEADRAARLEQIDKLGKRVEEIEVDRAEQVKRLGKQLEESEADRSARLEANQKLGEQLADSEADRAARLEVIQKLGAQLQESQADRAARLVVIQNQEVRLRRLEEANLELSAIKDHFLVRTLMRLGLVPHSKKQKEP